MAHSKGFFMVDGDRRTVYMNGATVAWVAGDTGWRLDVSVGTSVRTVEIDIPLMAVILSLAGFNLIETAMPTESE